MNAKTVYLVDDNDAFRKSTVWLLRTAGFEVTDFDNGRDALDAMKRQPAAR